MSTPERPDATTDGTASSQPAALQSSPADGGAVPEAYVIPRALAQATLEYLAAQPYREVFPLVRGFESLEPLVDQG